MKKFLSFSFIALFAVLLAFSVVACVHDLDSYIDNNDDDELFNDNDGVGESYKAPYYDKYDDEGFLEEEDDGSSSGHSPFERPIPVED